VWSDQARAQELGKERARLTADLAELDRTSKGTQQLDGEFTQHNRMKLFKQELVSKGRLSFSAPRKVRWEYTSPDPSTLILDGNTATLTAPGTALSAWRASACTPKALAAAAVLAASSGLLT